MSQCYHCHLPIPDGITFTAQILSEERNMCCPGCQAVAQAIVQQGMEDYYRYRTEPASKVDEDDQTALPDFLLYDEPTLQEEYVAGEGNRKQIQLTIDGISCAACAWLIEKTLNKEAGIAKIGVNVSAQRATLDWHDDLIQLSEILHTLKKIGYIAFPFTPDREEAIYKQRNKTLLTRLGMAGLLTMQVMMLAAAQYFDVFSHVEKNTQQFFNWVGLLLTTPVVFFSASLFFKNAYKALMAKSANMDVPVSIAVIGLYISSAWATMTTSGETNFESICMFIFLLLVSRYVEHKAKHQGNIMASNISQHLPVKANLVTDRKTQTVLAKSLKQDDIVMIRSGEAIPADGVILDGSSDVDEAMLTGESLPQIKQQGDLVYAGTLNQSGTLQVKIMDTLSASRINKIMRLQELALSDKPNIAKFTDSIAHYFVLFILIAAALTYTFWLIQGSENALWIAISVLVATCPCALGLATPTAITMAMYHLNKAGWLVRRADILEIIPQISHIIFDKTGTLTEGKLTLSQRHNLSNYSDCELDNIVAALESRTHHPIASAFDVKQHMSIDEFNTNPGLGISGNINGQRYKVGNDKFMSSPVPESLVHCNVFVEEETRLIGAYYLTDNPKADIYDAIEQLKSKQLSILSGDKEQAVSELAKKIGIHDYKAQCSPEQKLEYLANLQSAKHKVLMVGDGINDAPVLAKADVSIAIGSASDLAKQSADLILLGKQLASIPMLFKVCISNQRKIRQNVSWAIGYNLFALPLAMMGFLSPWMGVIGMSASSILVVVNSTIFNQLNEKR